MKKINLTIFFYLLFYSILSHSTNITGTFIGYESEKYVSISLSNLSHNKIIQSVYLKNGKLELKIEEKLPAGIYRLIYSSFYKKGFFDIVIENEIIINFKIDVNNVTPTPVFIISDKNKDWYEYKSELQKKINTIDKITQNIVLLKLNKNKEAEKLAIELNYLKQDFYEFKKEFISKKEFSIVGLYEKNFHSLFSNPNLDPKENLYQIKDVFFKDVNYYESLINTTLYNDLFFNYFSLCLKIDKDEFQINLEKNVKQIPEYLTENQTIRDIISNILISNFQIENEKTKIF
jgi:hypothetical protein